MRDQFNGFYGPTEADIDAAYKDSETFFIFDTNILLSLYRCEESTRTQFLEVWRSLKSQIWLPFHVCLEYQRNRLTVVQSARSSLKDIDKAMRDKLDKIFIEFNKDTLSRYSNLKNELIELKEQLLNVVSQFTASKLEARRSSIDYINSHDELRDIIDELTEGRMGREPTQATIDAINKDGLIRYKYLVGPGFADAKEKQNDRFSYNNVNYDALYSDLYVWRQIIEEVKKKNIKKVVYVTNDEKEDFYFKINGKTRGPVESLVTEIKREANTDIFLLHKIDSFLHHAVKSLDAKIDEPSINELASAAVSTRVDVFGALPIFGSFYSSVLKSLAKSNNDAINALLEESEKIGIELLNVKNKVNQYDLLLDSESLSFEEKEKLCVERNDLQSVETFLQANIESINDKLNSRYKGV